MRSSFSLFLELGETMALTQITLTASLLGGALGQMIIGPMSDARGSRGPLLVGMALYTLTSLLCLVAPSIDLLIGLRFAQGFTTAAGVVIARALARDLYTHRALARCIVNLGIVWNWPNLGESTSVAAILPFFPCSEKGSQSSDKLIIHQF